MRRPASRHCVGFGSPSECSKGTRTEIGTGLGQRFPIFGIDVGLAQDASQGTDRNLVFSWNDSRVHGRCGASHKLDVAALLGGFNKSCSLSPPLDFAEG